MKISARRINLKELRFKLKHKRFVFERKWLCHPFFHRFYPKPGFARRLIAALVGFSLLTAAILILFGSLHSAHLYRERRGAAPFNDALIDVLQGQGLFLILR